MNIRVLQQGDESSLENYLQPHTETCMFILSNLRKTGFTYRDEPFYGEYIAAFSDNDAMQGVFVHYWNGNIMAHASTDLALSNLAVYFSRSVKRPVAGIVCEDGTAIKLIDELGLTRQAFNINQKEDLYAMSLDELKFLAGKDNKGMQLRHVTEVDPAILFRWHKDYELEALKCDDTPTLNERIKQSLNGLSLATDQWVLVADGIPVSLCGFNARLPEIVQIGPVYTPPQQRNKGFAKHVVAWTLYKAKQEGVKKSVLFTNNRAAANAYQAVGFKKIGRFRLAILKDACFPLER